MKFFLPIRYQPKACESVECIVKHYVSIFVLAEGVYICFLSYSKLVTKAMRSQSTVKRLIDNIYIKVGNKVFRQQVGIPMGTDCAPFLANLFLFYYEYEYIKNLVKDNLQAAMKLQWNYEVY